MSILEQIAPRVLTLMQDAAAGAYVTGLGFDYNEKREAVLKEIITGFEPMAEDLKAFLNRAESAGLKNADPKFFGQCISVFATDLALRAAAKVCGEPPAKDEAKPEAEAVH